MPTQFIEVDAHYMSLLKMMSDKDATGLFEALQALPPKDPKVPMVIDMINHVTGLNFALTEDYVE